jgi:hypothetical protein
MYRIAVLVPFLLSGCVVYPVYKTLQPETVIVVQDETGQPVPDARVTLISSAYPYGRQKSQAVQFTGIGGETAFAAIREWQMESFMIHGWQEYFWNLCVFRSAAKFAVREPIRLVKGKSSLCRQRL